MPATIRDVARLANVGIGTVSRVINNSPSVRKQTREKVLAAIETLDFEPNPAARRLSGGRTHTISVILPHLTIPSFVERLRGIKAILDYSDYDLILYSAVSAERRDRLFKSVLRKSRTDGIIIISIRPGPEILDRMVNSDVHIVLIDTYLKEVPSVYIDNIKGGRIATTHLVNLGHRKIGFISDYLANDFRFSAMQERYTGYREALSEAQLPFTPEYHIEVPHDRKETKLAAERILNLPNPPTAIFASSDIQAIGVLDAAKALNIKVPDQLSVIGFDDIRDSEYVDLTTIRQPLYETGVIGIQLLLESIENKNRKIPSKALDVELVIRGTTAEKAG